MLQELINKSLTYAPRKVRVLLDPWLPIPDIQKIVWDYEAEVDPNLFRELLGDIPVHKCDAIVRQAVKDPLTRHVAVCIIM